MGTDLNAKLIYLTHPKSGKKGAILNMKDPMVLADKYGKKKRERNADKGVCHVEMQEMLHCLKRNNGMDDKCGQQVASLLKGEKNQTEVENLKSGLGADGEIDPKVATRILKKNAQQPNREAWRIQRNLLTKLPGIKMQRYPQ